ncbi:butyrophilin subfamily 3 member A2-like isoform X2 [Cebidichthys violaceus]
MLPCSLENENIVPEQFHWRTDGQKEVFQYKAGSHHNNGRPGQDELFKGRVTHLPHELKHGNASIILSETKATDSGRYICEFPLLQPGKRRVIKLVVAAAPKVFITLLDVTESMVWLRCDVQGASPEPEVEWRDGDGNVLPAEEPQVSERGGGFNVALGAKVTKAGRYRCVATQEDVGHVTDAHIDVSEKLFENRHSRGCWTFCGLLDSSC